MQAVTSGLTLEELEEKYNAGADRSALQRVTAADIAAIFAHLPAVQQIELVGHTPYFNDGEPCTHSQSEAVNGAGTSWRGDMIYTADQRVWLEGDTVCGGYREDMDEEQQEGEADNLLTREQYKAQWLGEITNPLTDRTALLMDAAVDPEPNGRTAEDYDAQIARAVKLIDGMELQIQAAWDTNFYILIRRTSDGIEIFQTDYEPGY